MYILSIKIINIGSVNTIMRYGRACIWTFYCLTKIQLKSCSDRCCVSQGNMWGNIPGAPKKYPLKILANFPRTIENYETKFYPLVIHSLIVAVITRPRNCIWKMLKKCPKNV